MVSYEQRHPNFGKSNLIFSNIFAEERKTDTDNILELRPDSVPVICEKSASSKLPDIDKTK